MQFESEGGVLVRKRTTAERLACTVLCAGVLFSSAGPLRAAPAAPPAPAKAPSTTGYHAGKQITFTPVVAKRGRMLVVGDTLIGALLNDKPNDKRRNLYVVAPGTQHRTGADDGLDFNLVLNGVPRTDEPVEWDVYWALTLDPRLQTEFTSENDLLLAAQESFTPSELFEFDDVPSADFLRKYLHIESVADLQQFRHPDDGLMPRVIIVGAKFVVRAAAVDPSAPPDEEKEGRISRALSRLHRQKQPATPTQQSVKK